jgi:hypothetical protein
MLAMGVQLRNACRKMGWRALSCNMMLEFIPSGGTPL